MAELLHWIVLEVASECALPFYYLHFVLLSYRFQHLLSCPLHPLPDVTYHMSHLSNAPHISNSAISSTKSRLSLPLSRAAHMHAVTTFGTDYLFAICCILALLQTASFGLYTTSASVTTRLFATMMQYIIIVAL